MNYILLSEYLAWWALFGIVHTATASSSFKKIIPLTGRSFRIFYNIINLAMFLVVSANTPGISPLILNGFEKSGVSYILFLFFFVLGIISFIIGGLQWDLLGFLGFKNETSLLNTTKMYKISRHPVYTGILLILVSTLFVGFNEKSLSWLLGAGGYFVIGTIPEEQKLGAFFGEYPDYKKNVGRFFPWRLSHVNYILGKRE